MKMTAGIASGGLAASADNNKNRIGDEECDLVDADATTGKFAPKDEEIAAEYTLGDSGSKVLDASDTKAIDINNEVDIIDTAVNNTTKTPSSVVNSYEASFDWQKKMGQLSKR